MKNNIVKSLERNAVLAVKEIKEQLKDVKDIKCIMFFASYLYEPDVLASAMSEHFPNIECFGVSANKEIIPDGVILSGSLVVLAFTSDLLEDFHLEVVENLSSGIDVKSTIDGFEEHFDANIFDLPTDKYFSLSFMDFNSKAEEQLFDKLGEYSNIILLGGTAADDWLFQHTGIYAKGKYYRDAAVVGLFKSKVKFGFEKIETVAEVTVDKPLTVTKSDMTNKILYEIDGRPAAEVYCEMNGLDYAKLSKVRDSNGIHVDFRKHPLGIHIEGEKFLRDVFFIDEANGSLVMICNIPEGLPVYFYEINDIIGNTRTQIENIRKKYNNISCMLTLLCSNMYEDIKRETTVEEYSSLFDGINSVGYCTYGEYYTVPVNHTTTVLVWEK
jgi:hypothetical protein